MTGEGLRRIAYGLLFVLLLGLTSGLVGGL